MDASGGCFRDLRAGEGRSEKGQPAAPKWGSTPGIFLPFWKGRLGKDPDCCQFDEERARGVAGMICGRFDTGLRATGQEKSAQNR